MNTKTITEAILITTLLTMPFVASSGETLTGRIIGHGCTVAGHVCPLDKLDPHIALEADFVLVVDSGEYYFMPNLQRGTKMRYVLDKVTVIGDVDKKYNTIDVNELIVDKGGKHRTVWSKKMQREEIHAAWGAPTR